MKRFRPFTCRLCFAEHSLTGDTVSLPKRKPTWLKDYDYSTPSAYFVTICTQNRVCLFELEHVGNDLRVIPPVQNQIIHTWITETQNKFDVKIDKYIIMPNHLHLIVQITERHIGRSLPSVMRFFKTMTTNAYIREVKNKAVKPFNKKLWQKSYHDHIIRNEADYQKIWNYIDTNPAKWQEDCFYIED